MSAIDPTERLSDADRWELAYQRYSRTINTFARNSFRQIPGYDIPDIEQELLIVLHNCVLKYNPNLGASFNTLFQGCAKNKVISLIRAANTQSRRSNLGAISLSVEEVARAVEAVFTDDSAESEALLHMEIRERLVGIMGESSNVEAS